MKLDCKFLLDILDLLKVFITFHHISFLFSFENIGNQIKSFFWTDEAEEKSIKKDLSGDLKAGREPRYEAMRYEAYEGRGDFLNQECKFETRIYSLAI